MLSLNSSLQNQKQQVIKQQYNKIYAHELAHKTAGGSLAGSIVIEKNSEGIPVAGHVNIKMPVLDKNNPDKTIRDAKTVINSALAPHDPSSQDYKVAAAAKSILSEAEKCKSERKLNFLA